MRADYAVGEHFKVGAVPFPYARPARTPVGIIRQQERVKRSIGGSWDPGPQRQDKDRGVFTSW
jgi:hypothetical protein